MEGNLTKQLLTYNTDITLSSESEYQHIKFVNKDNLRNI